MSNAFSINVGQYLVNEINLGYEHFFSDKKSIELNGGIIYRNDIWLNLASDWANSQYFNEHGFAARFFYKIYKKSPDKRNTKSFYAFGLNYQYLYYGNEWIETEREIQVKNSLTGEKLTVNEEIYRHRLRHRIGTQLLLGNVFQMGKNFAVEIFYGLGLRGIFSDRFDVYRGATVEDEKVILQDLDFADSQFYIRPSIHAGLKLKLGW